MVQNLTYVADLIDHNVRRWRESLIRSIFSAYEADLILQILMSIIDTTDRVIWAAKQNGFFTRKSAYSLILQEVESSVSGLFCGGALFFSGVPLSPVYLVYFAATETMAHALFYCPSSRLLWFQSHLSIRVPDEDGFSLISWLESFMELMDEWILD